MRKRPALILLLPLLCAGLLEGCWNYREVDNLMIVAGVAIDQGYEGHKYHITIDLADTSNAGKDKPVITTLVESEGDTLSNAVDNTVRKVGMELYWPNCQVAVISQDVALESITPVVDWLNRTLGPRLTIELFVSQDSTAKDSLRQQSSTMAITSFELDKFYELNERVQPIAEYKMLYDVYNTLSGKGRSLTLPAVSLQEDVDNRVVSLNGMAIFDGDRLIGYLTPDDSRTAMFVTNHIKGGSLHVKAPTGNTIACLEIYANATKVSPSYADGKLTVTVETKTEVSLDELDTRMDMASKEKLNEFEFEAESQLAAEIGKVVRNVQTQYGVDIFGFGELLHKSDPAAWYPLEQNWDDVFRNAQVQVSCKINFRNKGQSRGPVGGGD